MTTRRILLHLGLQVIFLAWASNHAGMSPISRRGNQDVSRFDEYGDLKSEDEKARIDNFAEALTADPGMHHRVCTVGRRSKRRLLGSAWIGSEGCSIVEAVYSENVSCCSIENQNRRWRVRCPDSQSLDNASGSAF